MRSSGLLVLVALLWLATRLTAAEVVVVAEGGAPRAPQQPQLHIDDAGVVHLAYAVGDTTYYARSADGGKSFAKPVALPPAHDISLGMRRGPRIASTGEVICVTVIGGRQGKGRDGDLLAFRSIDDGRTWQGPVAVNDVANAAREGLHAMAAGPEGQLGCVWLDLRSRGTQVMASTSDDGGKTWSKNVRVYRSPGGSVCECCHPSVAFDRQGSIHVLWRNSLNGARDMYVASSRDGGKAFGEAKKLGRGTWTLKACPMDGGALAPLSGGALATVWRRKNEVFLTRAMDDEEQSLGAGEQPWLAATPAGPAAVWLTKRGGDLLFKAPGGSAVTLAAGASDPVIAAAPEGRLLVAAWEWQDGDQTQIVCRALGE